MVTSKVIFCTHGTLFRWVPRGMKIINLWHGFGFKAVGTFLEGNNGHACTCTIASSEYSRKFFAIEMNQETDQVFPLGFPRNDRLIKAFGNRELITKNLGFDNFKKIIFWMPTYRTSTEGDIRKDGVQYNNPFNLEHFDIDLFYNYLTGNNFLCLFRAHPMSLKFDLGENSNFRITTDKWLFEHEVTLYQLLGITDLLISDVSSVITDYLLIDKPVIHAMSDFDEYVATRPLLLTPPRDFLVGPLVEDQQNLIGEIDKIVKGPDSFKEKRNELKVLFFDKNTDDKSTYRILKQFKI
jgi:CDP-glycerol glycerophosphotransferase (TagB/SpsB family)